MAPTLLLVLACGGAPGDAPEDSAVASPADLVAEATLDDDIPTVAWVRWTTDTAGTSLVEHGPTPALGYATVPGEAATTDHAVLLAGMAAASTWYWRAVSVVDGERRASPVYTIATGVAPRDLPRATSLAYDPARAAPGYTITTSIGTSAWIVFFAPDGSPVWWQKAPEDRVVAQVRLSPDGTSVLYNLGSLDFTTDIGVIRKVRLDGELLSETRTVMGHHDFVELPEGGFGYIQADFREWVDPGTGTAYTVAGDSVVEVPEGATEETAGTTVWSAWDHFEVAVDPRRDADFYPGVLDWTHCNSLFLGEDGAYTISVRKENAFVRVDRATREQVWQVGGVGSDFRLSEGRDFVGQHSPEPIEGGFLLFDNGDPNADEAYSEAVQYALDEASGVYSPVWRYDYGKAVSSYLLGDVERLANGNTLVAWGSGGTLTEVTPEGELVLQIRLGIGSALGFTHHVDALGGVAP